MATRSKKDADGDSTQDLFYSLDPAARNAIRAKLLEALVTEQDASTRNKMGDAVAEIARQYAAEGQLTGSVSYTHLTLPTKRIV